jgi:hypothetical protein
MVKVLQCKLLYERDVLMYHAESDTPLVARTTTLNEELGQVRCGGLPALHGGGALHSAAKPAQE